MACPSPTFSPTSTANVGLFSAGAPGNLCGRGCVACELPLLVRVCAHACVIAAGWVCEHQHLSDQGLLLRAAAQHCAAWQLCCLLCNTPAAATAACVLPLRHVE